MKKVAAIILIVCIGIMMIAVSGCQKVQVEQKAGDVSAQADSAATAAIDTAAAAVAETVQEVAQ